MAAFRVGGDPEPWLEPAERMRHRRRISSHSVAAGSERPHHDPSCTRCWARRAGPICRTAYHSQPIQRSARPDPARLIRPRGCACLLAPRWRSARLQHRAVRHLAVGQVAPESDQELPAKATIASGGPGRDPAGHARGTRRSRRSRAGGAATARRARPSACAGAGCRTWRCPVSRRSRRSARARRQPGVGRHLPPVGEAAEQGLQPQPRGELGTNPLQAQ